MSKHPGTVLKETLIGLGITEYALAKSVGVQQTKISQIIKGKRSITVDTSMRLGRYFSMPAVYWLHLQNEYDISTQDEGKYASITPLFSPK